MSVWNEKSEQRPKWLDSRKITKRLVVTGTLVLKSPAQFGNGDTDGPTDMSLLLDPLEGRALLTGASLAGALRNYVREHEDADPDHKKGWTTLLFGGAKGDDDGSQSPLIIDDALGDFPQIELRDGVAIDPATRTALDGKKFDMELLQVGTTFDLRFEVAISGDEQVERRMKRALALALHGLENGHIHLGARKKRGMGECAATGWQLDDYDLTTPRGLLDWLDENSSVAQTGQNIAALLGARDAEIADQRERFHMNAHFWLDSSLLIRSGFGAADAGADAEHLHRRTVGSDQRKPVLSGTSLAGVIRHRALRIAQTLAIHNAADKIDMLFGREPKNGDPNHVGSRVLVKETEIRDVRSMLQNRIRIDRFTGGVLDNYLFSELPIWGGPDTVIKVDVSIHNPQEWEIGLLLLVLKDLWTADLPLGGGANIGRGRVHGLWAELSYQRHGVEQPDSWCIQQPWDKRTAGLLTVEPKERVGDLQNFVNALMEQAQEVMHG